MFSFGPLHITSFSWALEHTSQQYTCRQCSREYNVRKIYQFRLVLLLSKNHPLILWEYYKLFSQLFSHHYLYLLFILLCFQTLLHCQVWSVHLQVFICAFCACTRVIIALDAPFPTTHCGHSFQVLFCFLFCGSMNVYLIAFNHIHAFTYIFFWHVCVYVCTFVYCQRTFFTNARPTNLAVIDKCTQSTAFDRCRDPHTYLYICTYIYTYVSICICFVYLLS